MSDADSVHVAISSNGNTNAVRADVARNSALVCVVAESGAVAQQQHALPAAASVRTAATPEQLATLVAMAHPETLIVFLSSTMVLEPYALEAFAQRLARTGVGAAVGRCLDSSGLRIKSAAYGLQNGRLAVALTGATRDHTRALRPCDCDLGGFPLAIRADVLAACGGIAGAYSSRYYDVDLVVRVRMLGQRVVYSPDAVVRDLDPSASWNGGSAADALQFVARFPDVFVPALDPLTFAA